MIKAQLRTNRWGACIADWWQRADLVHDLGRALLVALVAAGIGLLFNVFIILPTAPQPSPEAERPVAEKISMTEAYQMVTSGQALIVDTREAQWYQEAHIADAVNLPGVEFDQYYPQFAAEVSTEQVLILYCDPGCMSKGLAFDELASRGHRNVRLMAEGVEEWEAAGYPVNRDPARTITDE